MTTPPFDRYPDDLPPPTSPPPAGSVPLTAYGVDPVTGLPYSDKSKVVAGLLQLLLGLFLVLGGVGRLYAGNRSLGIIQLVATGVAWLSACCAFFLLVPIVVTIGCWVWFVVDGIVLLAGHPTDEHGRLLRG